MSKLLGRSAGFAGILISGLMVLTSCGAAATPTPVPATAVPTKPAAPTATTAPTAVPTPAATVAPGGPTATPAIAATANNQANQVSTVTTGACTVCLTAIPKYTAAQVKTGGTFHIFIGNDPACFDPYCASTGISPPMFLITHQKLIRYKAVQYPEYSPWGAGVFQGDLVQSWDISADGKTFTLHLRQGDNWPALTNVDGITLPARQITSDDVLFSWATMVSDPLSVVKSFYASQISATAPDSMTVVAKTDNAYADWIGTTYANGETQFVIRKDFVQAMGTKYGLDFGSMFGSGAFMPGKSTQGAEYDFVKNPTYFDPTLPHVDAITQIIIKDTATAQAAFLAGQLDVQTAPTLAQGLQWIGQDKDITMYRGEALGHNPQGMQWFVPSGPGSNLMARQAISKLFPWDGDIQAQYAGTGAYDGCIPSGFVSVSLGQADLKALYPYDPAGAKALLTQAGFSASNPFVFDSLVDPANSTTYVPQATLLQASVAATGIAKMNIIPIAFNQSRAQVIGGKFTSAWQPLASGTVTKIFNAYYGGGAQGPMGSQNYMQLNDPKVNQMYEQQSVDFNTADRATIIQAFQTYCAQQAWVLPTPTPPAYQAVRGWIKNFGYNDFYLDEDRYDWLWIDHTS
jgi:peptide/nickel transport system substrate-binding protein